MNISVLPEPKFWQQNHPRFRIGFRSVQQDTTDMHHRDQLAYEEDARSGRVRCLCCHHQTDHYTNVGQLLVQCCRDCLRAGNRFALPLLTVYAENAGLQFATVPEHTL